MKINKDFVIRNFGNAAKDYDSNNRLQRRVAHELIARCKRFDGKILDVGAGTGFIHDNTGFDLTEIDISAAVCKANGRAICADVCALPFDDNSFDNVVSSLTLQWVEDDVAAASEIYRVLKKGGRICLSTFGAASLTELKKAGGNALEFGSAMKYFAAFKKAGFDKLNIDSQKIIYLHDDIYELLGSIKKIGASYPFGKGLKTKSYFKNLEEKYKAQSSENGQLKLTWEVLYISGVKR